jgi:hypothetical protein
MNKLFKRIAVVAAMLMAVTAQAKVTECTVWGDGDSDSKYYRIPALTHTADGKIVAIADNRFSNSKDIGGSALYNSKVQIESKIGTLVNGKWTWSDANVVAPGYTPCGDAAVCFDKNTNEIVCLFAAEHNFNEYLLYSGKIYMTRSKDGIKWDTPTDITSQISKKVSNYSTGFVASGNMCYTSGGKILAVVNTKIHPSTFSYKDVEVVICSEDDGYTWSVLNDYSKYPLSSGGNESKIVELSQNNFLMSIRTDGNQQFSRSTNGGKTWTSAAVSNSELTNADCNGDIIKVSYNGVDYLLQSIANSSSTREKVSIFASADNGDTWTKVIELCSGNSAYSSLLAIDDNTIGCLVEVGDDDNGYDIKLYTITLKDLTTPYDPFDGSLICDGSGYVKVPNFDAMNVKAGEKITISARVFVDASVQGLLARDFGVLSTRCYPSHSGLQYTGAAGIEFTAGRSAEKSFGSNVTLDGKSGSSLEVVENSYSNGVAYGSWAYVAQTIDTEAGVLRTYVNGKNFEESTFDAGSSISMVDALLIGTRYDLNGFISYSASPSTDDILNGRVDDVRIYKSSFTDDEIVADMNSGFPLSDKNLIAAYDFADQDYQVSAKTRSASNAFTDISGNGNNAEVVTVDDYTLPTISHDYLVTPKSATGGVVNVTRYFGGEITLDTDEAYEASYGQDFKVTAVPAAGYILVAVYVNDEEVENGSFFKALDSETVVTAVFRKIDFYIVDANNTDNKVKLISYDDDGKYTYDYGDIEKLPDQYYVVGLDSETGDTVVTLYADYEGNEAGIKVMNEGEAYNLAESGVNFSPVKSGVCDDNFYIAGASVLLVYTDDAKTLKILKSVTNDVQDLSVADSDETDAVYYNLQGIRVNIATAPAGVYVRRAGITAGKVVKR